MVSGRQGVVPIEVTSGCPKDSLPGLQAFTEQYEVKRSLLVGGQGTPIERFLARPATDLMR